MIYRPTNFSRKKLLWAMRPACRLLDRPATIPRTRLSELFAFIFFSAGLDLEFVGSFVDFSRSQVLFELVILGLAFGANVRLMLRYTADSLPCRKNGRRMGLCVFFGFVRLASALVGFLWSGISKGFDEPFAFCSFFVAFAHGDLLDVSSFS
jgi:hypothetical protein